MWNTVKLNDLLALVILWGMVVLGFVIGDAKPAHRPEIVACVAGSGKSPGGAPGG